VSSTAPAVPADYSVTIKDNITAVLPSGDWTVLALGDAPVRLESELAGVFEDGGRRLFDATKLGDIDTAGAFALIRAIGRGQPEGIEVNLAGREDLDRLRELVGTSHAPEPVVHKRPPTLRHLFETIGRSVVHIGREAYRDQTFIGLMMTALGRTLVSPRRLRLAPLVATMEQAGLNGLPIVFLMTFFIGAILALVGSTMLRALGVEVYTVEMVGIGVMREFGVVITAILFAGRSAAAFAAQIGSMRMTQETDAMEVMGVDVFDALVVPRVVAALIMVPVMTLVADIGGLLGGMLTAWVSMDISPAFFLHRLVEMVGLHQFWVGMSKAPLFAITVAAAGCRHGLSTEGDVSSLGMSVTSAVVQSIFMVIMFDAIFALMFMHLNQ